MSDSVIYGPTTPFAEQLHIDKYRLKGETFRECINRVAHALSDKDNAEHFHTFRDILLNMRFLPGGRIQAAAGAPRRATLFNCFVSGKIADSFVDGEGSIMQRFTEAAATLRMGGGTGYGFGTLRPAGALIKSLGSASTGPCAFMGIGNSIGNCTASVGKRRGAQMGVLPIWHPDIEEYIHLKHDRTTLTRFNVSIGVTDEFMEKLDKQQPFDLRFEGQVYKTVDSVELWETIMRSTWDWAEPGVLFMDRINAWNNLYYCEEIEATNPCGEQPLPPFGACLLGSYNLVKYLIKQPDGKYTFDWAQLREDIPHVVRAMDNVVDVSLYPLEAQRAESVSKRRMGLGVAGLANAGEALGHPYGSRDFIQFTDRVLTVIRDHSYLASTQLAKEKGPFPLFDKDKYLAGKFVSQLPEHVRYQIEKCGIRNSHLGSIAPTGTISQTADNVSSGGEPVFDYTAERDCEMSTGKIKVAVDDYGYKFLGVKGKRCRDVTADEHVDTLIAMQNRVDSSVSKTCNVPSDMPWKDFGNVYLRAYKGGAKGCTTYQLGCKRGAVLTEMSAVKEEACTINPETGEKSCGE